ncbi:AEC family transporter [Ramlibacter tataouinensis]|uniref:Permease-like protein n=1 Tax=Ramlibacter tataouinensis (strain ATCC BAA-407 / DSM 14655 / LMG 21543 / TTB310) TaxID=365046 RepID=F5Y202_RAMTT|nr:AEC family transporter [Ramlibacter tataouinensis]AEG93586.1 permease-like protein [Ramlibacter tataouinensis TTB310]
MLQVLAVTGPIYLVIAAGWLATRWGLFSRAEMRVFGKYVIHLALPALLFNALSQRSVAEVLNPVFAAAYALGSLVAMAAGILWARRVAGKPLSASAIVGMGMSCSNSGFIGFPLVAQVFGAGTAGVGLALAMVVENFLLLPLALAIADGDLGEGAAAQGRAARWRTALAQSLRGVVRNPMIHGIAAGFLFALLGWRLPEAAARAVNLFAASCAAISLFVIGGSLVGIAARGMAHDVTAVAAGKLLLHPLAVLAAVWLLPPMARELQTAVVIMAAVPMLGIYPILAQKHGHDTMAAAAQLGTTVASFVTLTALLWVLR